MSKEPRLKLHLDIRGAVVLLSFAAALHLQTSQAQQVFSDNFDSGASPSWSNPSGTWVASGGVYSSGPWHPGFSSMLPFALTNFTVDVDIHAVADGGVWLRGDGTGQNGILLVTGGDGWGWGSRIGNAGKALYFHVVTNGAFSPYLGEATNVFTPEVSDVHLRIQVNGNTYSAFTNGNTTPTCSITDTNFTSGQVGLFAFSTQTFDNFAISNLPPVLDIHNGVVISWPADYTGYVLEETTNPASSNWVAVPIPPRVVNQVILPSAEGNKFFRLRKP